MKLDPKNITCIIMTTLFVNIALADVNVMPHMTTSENHIQGLQKTLTETKKTTHIPVEFPAFIPKSTQHKKLYSNLDMTSQQNGFSYIINIDSTADCKGVKYCNVGQLSARPGTQIEKIKDRKNKVITIPVLLADGMQAYFTPGHAMGDYFPANIQWIDQNVVYMITWQTENLSPELTRALFTTMANSAKHPGSG